MAGGIAHEIRNPLAVVSSAAQLLLEKPLTRAVQRECSEKIHRGVQRAAGVIESLLRFARPSSRGGMRTLDLVRVVEDARALVANQLRLEQIELSARLPGGPLWLEGNASLLQQLVANLLLNAANAMVHKSGRIELAIEEVDGVALLRVADNGRGIPAEDLPKVFDPFFTTMPVGLRCVLVTGYLYEDDEAVRASLRTGLIAGFIGKPFLLHHLQIGRRRTWLR
jgi:signal transduction histidine kinase